METFTPRPRTTRKKKEKPCSTLPCSPDRSEDSIPSVIFPHSKRTRISGRPPLREISEEDQRYQVVNLFIFFSVVIQIVSGISIICLGIVLITVNYRLGLLGDLQVNLSLYLFEASGMLFLVGAYMTSLNYNFDHLPNYRHLISCTVFSTINLLCLVAVIGLGLKTSADLKDKTLKDMNILLIAFYSDPEANRFFNKVQYEYDCCGILSRRDWESSSLKLPPSCCNKFSTEDTCLEWKDNGCYETYYSKMYSFINYVIGFGFVSVGIVILTLISTIVTFCYGKMIRKLHRRGFVFHNNAVSRFGENYQRDDSSEDRIVSDSRSKKSVDSDRDELERIHQSDSKQPVV